MMNSHYALTGIINIVVLSLLLYQNLKSATLLKRRKVFSGVLIFSVAFCVADFVIGFFLVLSGFSNLKFYVSTINYLIVICVGVSFFIFVIKDKREQLSMNALRIKQKEILSVCEEILEKNLSLEDNISLFLDLIAKCYHSKNASILEANSETKSITKFYQWIGETPFSQDKEAKRLLNSSMVEWYEIFSKDKQLYIEDFSVYQNQFPNIVKFAKKSGIKTLMAVPLITREEIFGAIIINNPSEFKNDFSVLKTISVFVNSEIQKRQFYDSVERISVDIIKALHEEYTSVFYIDLQKDLFFPYAYDDSLVQIIDPKKNKDMKYSKASTVLIQQNVLEDDKLEMFEFCDIENLKSILAHRHSVSKKFKSIYNGKPELFEVLWVKIGGIDEPPGKVIIALANIEQKIQEKEKQANEREKYLTQLDSAVRKAEEIARESQIDKLTGVYNKVSGLDIVSKFLKAKEEDESYALLFIDLDKFKNINDEFGHLEGDEILKGVGKAITSKCRAGDIAIRFGGDEFVVILKRIDDEKIVTKKANMIATEIAKLSHGKEYTTTVSIGGYITSDSDLQNVLDCADKALYVVKQKGRDGVKINKDRRV